MTPHFLVPPKIIISVICYYIFKQVGLIDMKNKYLILCIFAFVGLTSCLKSQELSKPLVEFNERIIADNLTNPWEILSDDNSIWFTERNGYVKRVNLQTLAVKQLLHIPDVYQNNEGGLLGMAILPSLIEESYVYLVYNYRGTGNSTLEKLVRYTYTSVLDTLYKPLVLIDNIAGSSIHNGSRLIIVGDKLFMTTGDAADQDLPQDLSSLSGKVLRMNLDGSIPEDNPFPNSYVWTYGHRNAQGMVDINDKIFISEHGPNTDDEINILEKGGNFGWPNVHGYCDGNKSGEMDYCNSNDVVEPILSLTPESTVAVAGMDYYNHPAYPTWNNSLLVTTLKNKRLMVLKLNEAKTSIVSQEEYFQDRYGRLRDVHVAKNGNIYLATSNNSNDMIIELVPKTTSVDQGKSELNIFPNPTNSIWNFKFDGEPIDIKIYNSIGIEIFSDYLQYGQKDYKLTSFDKFGNKLPSGIYYVMVNYGSKIENLLLILH